uniref:Uncharacterized protein n=1 Tax=Arundo donax TaxID=35708 RepID=A0A0A8YKU8_ARUDO
MGLEWAVHGP